MAMATEQAASEPRANRIFWRGLLSSPSAITGLILIVLVVAAAIFAPLVAPFDPIKYNPVDRLQGPSFNHLLGTDLYGRDTLSRVIFGARVSLSVSAIAVLISLCIGGGLGVISGFRLGWFDTLVMRLTDVLLAFPAILLAIALLAFLGGGFWNLTLAIAIVYSAPFARVSRAAVLRVREDAFVEASRALGASNPRVLWRHILPNAFAPMLIEVTLRLAYAILSEASLSYLGLGTPPPAPAWGQMISDGRRTLELAPWASIGPGLAIMMTVLGFNLLGDGLRDILDPRLRNR
jgi:peptide/nickel transport system permease protein